MKFNTYNDHEIAAVDIDGQKSDPITPLSPEVLERFKRRRDAYLKSGFSEKRGVLIIDVDAQNADPVSSVPVELLVIDEQARNRSPASSPVEDASPMKEPNDAANGSNAERKSFDEGKSKPEPEAQ